MAVCTKCGRWAGFFRSQCRVCASASTGLNAETEAIVALHPPLRTQEGHRPDMFSVQTDGSFSDASEALAGFSTKLGSSVKRIGVRAERKGPNARRLIASVPELQMIVGRELRRSHIDDTWTGPIITAKLLDAATLNATEADFLRWCRSEDAPAPVRMFDKERLGLLFWAAWALDNSATHLDQTFDEAICIALPFLQISAFACRNHEGTLLDNFTAKWDDPIWTTIWPPNDWLCSCNVISLLESQVSDIAVAKQPGIARLSPDTWVKCSEWYTRSPRAALKLHPERHA